MTTLAPDDGGGLGVRVAERADLLDVHRIERASFPQPWPYAAFERYLDEPGFLVADESLDGPDAVDPADADGDREWDGAIVGYVVADTVPNHGTPLGHVKDIAVAPGRRGAGVGTTLLEHALGVLAEAGVESVKLEVRESNDGAISLYRDEGFEHARTIPNYYGNGEDALVMVRAFGNPDAN